jgi:small subunit ribosomal protein S1
MSDANDERRDEDFAAMLDASLKQRFAPISPGDRIEGRIVALGTSTLLLDIGQRCEGVIDRGEFKPEELQALAVGDVVPAHVVRVGGSYIRLSRAISARELDVEGLREALAAGVPIEGKVSGENKGGYTVELPGGKGFVPHSQIEMGAKLPASEYVGKTLRFRIVEIRGRDVILSRAALQREESARERERLLADLHEGAVMQAAVVKIESFGVFVDLGAGLHALVPASELAWSRRDEAKASLHPGDGVTVTVMRVETGKDGRPRISCSMRRPDDDPWALHGGGLAVGRTVRGRVTRLQPFGAFVEVAPGLEGLLHVSEMSAKKRVTAPAEVVKPGDEVTVAITAIDPSARRMSLSMKVVETEAEEAIDPEVRARFVVSDRGAAPAAPAAPAAGGTTAFAEAFRRAKEREARRRKV